VFTGYTSHRVSTTSHLVTQVTFANSYTCLVHFYGKSSDGILLVLLVLVINCDTPFSRLLLFTRTPQRADILPIPAE
jgi:hypothetical protein